VFPDDPPWEPFGFSVLGSVAGMMGTLAALESIKMLTGFSQRLDRMLICDLDDYELKKLKVKQREDCICRQH
jgi:molybdopterin/thiamine biosynthesis adenylyltransferase